jgi:hypothetical protein
VIRARVGRPRNWGSVPGRDKKVFSFSVTYKPALGPSQHPIQWVRGLFSSDLKRQVGGAVLPLPHTSSWCDA